jgi:hypothetical protein
VSALASVPRSSALGVGTRLGRFTMTRMLGEGAMGEVWAARDPELDREVAIKLLRVSSARLRREAQAMARVRHPNVVAIYELAWTNGQGFCAMELVDGETLRAHLATPRSWRTVLPIALAVGRGLSAAHGTGVIHRDIKPENVLIARDGRTLVSDFGLAKLAGPDDDAAVPAARDDEASTTRLTTVGALIGTPAYMAPEQLAGEPASMLSDQFSFCVVVYEALFGARPFEAATIGRLAEAIRAGLTRRPELRGVPRRVLDVLERGLAAKPSARWPSMDALLQALERAMRRRRWWLAAAAPALVAMVAAIGYIAIRGDAPDEDEARAAAERTISDAWNPSVARELATAFTSVDAKNGPGHAAALSSALDKYRDDWLAARFDAWAATHIRGEQSVELLQRRLACLNHLADSLGQLVTLLAAPTSKEILRASDLAARLEPVASCNNARRLAAQSIAPSTPEGRAVAAELDRLEAMQMIGRDDDALRRAQAALVDPATVADPMLHARARYNLGVALMNEGHDREAETTLRLAVQEAAAAHDQYLVATLWSLLVELIAEERPKDALALEPVAKAAVAQAGDDPRQLAHLAFALGMAESQTDPDRAHDRFIEARDRGISLAGADSEWVAEVEINLGVLAMNRDHYDEAGKYLDHARQTMVAKFGDKYPGVATIDSNRAEIAAHNKDWPAAEALFRGALAIDVAVHGPTFPEVLVIYTDLAEALRTTGRYAEAHQTIALARQGVTVDNAASSEAIDIDLEDAALALAEHEWSRAEAVAKRAIDAYEKLGGQLNHSIATDALARATVHRAPREALALEQRALDEYFETSHSDSDAAGLLGHMADIAIAAKRPDVALAWFDKYPDAAAHLSEVRTSLERLQHGHSR